MQPRRPDTEPVGPTSLYCSKPLTLLRSFSVQKEFVDTVRAVELTLGIPVPGLTLDTKVTTTNFTEALGQVANTSTIFNANVKQALAEAAPMLVELAIQLAVPALLDTSLASGVASRTTLLTT